MVEQGLVWRLFHGKCGERAPKRVGEKVRTGR